MFKRIANLPRFSPPTNSASSDASRRHELLATYITSRRVSNAKNLRRQHLPYWIYSGWLVFPSLDSHGNWIQIRLFHFLDSSDPRRIWNSFSWYEMSWETWSSRRLHVGRAGRILLSMTTWMKLPHFGVSICLSWTRVQFLVTGPTSWGFCVIDGLANTQKALHSSSSRIGLWIILIFQKMNW